MLNTHHNKSHENRVRRKAARLGYGLKKSRSAIGIYNVGEYALIDWDKNFIILGEQFGWPLDEIEGWLDG